MAADEELLNALEAIVTHPGLYWGNSDNHFHSLQAFLIGYSVARSPLPNAEYHKEIERIIPPDFSRFVADHFGEKGYAAGHDWARIIEEHTTSDREPWSFSCDCDTFTIKTPLLRPCRNCV